MNYKYKLNGPDFTRKGSTIRILAVRGTPATYGSINKAKRKSRELQMKNGGLGCGSLIVR